MDAMFWRNELIEQMRKNKDIQYATLLKTFELEIFLNQNLIY